MADRKISDLTALTTTATGDLIPIVDVSEAAAADKNKSITVQELFQGIPGNVGIGLESPNAKLEVRGGTIRFGDNDASANSFGLLSYGGNTGLLTLNARATGGSTQILFNTSLSGTDSEAARINSNGRLLVGTSTARTNWNDSGIEPRIQIEGAADDDSAALTIVANSGTTNSDKRTGLLVLGRTRGTAIGSNTAVVQDDAVGMIEFKGSDGTNFTTAATIRAQVDGSIGTDDMPGRLVFSVTRDGSASPTGRAQIDNAGRFYTFNAAGTEGAAFMTEEGAGTTYQIFGGWRSATTVGGASAQNVFRVYTNGDTQNTNNSYTGISDIKLKENVVDAASQWSDIKSLQVRKYNFKVETGNQTHTQIGLIAQEVELVSPGLVNESPDRDAEGNDLGTVTKSVNYSVLYMKAVKALQEAMERIETLEQRLNDAGIS